MFLQFQEPVLGRTRSTRKDSIRVTESFGIGMTGKMLVSEMLHGLPFLRLAAGGSNLYTGGGSLNAASSASPFGLPRPVQASQPGRAV